MVRREIELYFTADIEQRRTEYHAAADSPDPDDRPLAEAVLHRAVAARQTWLATGRLTDDQAQAVAIATACRAIALQHARHPGATAALRRQDTLRAWLHAHGHPAAAVYLHERREAHAS